MVRLAFLLALCAGAVQAAPCRLALVLALDVSSSVDKDEDRLQRQGLAAAFLAPEVQQAFFSADLPVSLSVFEWSGRYHQSVLLNWQMIQTEEDLAIASRTIAASQRSYAEFPTAMGKALEFGHGLLAQGPACLHRTIDISGDGQNNEDFGPRTAYARSDFSEITVNGLVINAAEFESETGLIAFYQAEVLHGPGAFFEVADSFSDFERAMRQKLVREVSAAVLGAAPPRDGNG